MKGNQYMNGKRMHYLIYKITNIRNGMIYIGKHETEDVNDGYMGSGTYLKAAMRKEGTQRFKKEILFDFTTRKEMKDKERELVNIDFIEDPNTYNMIEGGMASSGNKTLKWICNDSTKVQKYIPIEIALSQKMIAEGWRYGQLKKIDLVELEYNNQKKTVREWSKELDVDSQILLDRQNAKWTNQEIFEIPFEYKCHKHDCKLTREKRKITFAHERKEKAIRFFKELNEIGNHAMIKKYGKASYLYKRKLMKEFVPEFNERFCNNRPKRIDITINDQTMSLSAWARFLNISNFEIYALVKKGFSKQEAIEHFYNIKKKPTDELK